MRKKNERVMMVSDLFSCFRACITRKRQDGRDSTADLYRAATNWLELFCEGKRLPLRRVTQRFVMEFEAYLKSKGLKVNTYLSNFRAMYNLVIDGSEEVKNCKPFAKLKIKQQATAKRALSREVMEEIAGLKLDDRPELEMAADLSLFSFMACGMAFVDLVHLKPENIREGEIIYNRRKTGTEIRIGMTEGMKIILDKYKQEDTPFLFPLLKEENASYETYKSLLRCQNEALKEIGQFLISPIQLTTYMARHSYATLCLSMGVPIETISQTLGHRSISTTQIYADITRTKINEDMTNLAERIEGKYELSK